MNDDIEPQLLRRFTRGFRQAAGPCPCGLELASYVDGRATEAQAARIEAHLAACPRCLEGVVQARRPDAADPVAPSRLVAQAKALVPLRLGRPFGWRRVASWAAVAAACAAFGFAGLITGSAVRYSKEQAQASLMSEILFPPPARYRALLASDDLLAAIPLPAKEGPRE